MYDYILDHLSQSDIDLIDIMAMTSNNDIIDMIGHIALSNAQSSLVFNVTARDIKQAIDLI